MQQYKAGNAVVVIGQYIKIIAMYCWLPRYCYFIVLAL